MHGSDYQTLFCSFPIEIEDADYVSFNEIRDEKVKVATNFYDDKVLIDLAGTNINAEKLSYQISVTDEYDEVVYETIIDRSVASISVDDLGKAGTYSIDIWDEINEKMLPSEFFEVELFLNSLLPTSKVFKTFDVLLGERMERCSNKTSEILLRKDGNFFARNIDDECYQIMKNLSESPLPNQAAPRKIDHVAFEPDGGWLILAEDYHFARNINDDCFKQMKVFRKNKNKIKIIAFTPNGKGWSIISNKKFGTKPNDIIRNFESNVGGKSVWQRMRDYNVPGVSVAVVMNGQVVWSTAYGHLKSGDRKNAVHPESMFQSASISKVLAAVGAYEMTEQALVQINVDLQNILNNVIPIHPCLTLTDSNSVTLRNILRHDSGIDGNVDSLYEAQLTNGSNCPKIQEGGYGGYSQSMAVRDLPSTTSIMSGSGKSTTERVRITYNNTSRRFTYSGPAFTTL
ncbi:MAG: hypothetical protein ACI94Y_002670 [Maribacter sp.]